jgi:hypothetical protein
MYWSISSSDQCRRAPIFTGFGKAPARINRQICVSENLTPFAFKPSKSKSLIVSLPHAAISGGMGLTFRESFDADIANYERLNLALGFWGNDTHWMRRYPLPMRR